MGFKEMIWSPISTAIYSRGPLGTHTVPIPQTSYFPTQSQSAKDPSGSQDFACSGTDHIQSP